MSERRLAEFVLKEEKRQFENNTLVLFFLWLIAPASQFIKAVHANRIEYYSVMLIILLPFVVLAGWLLYNFKVLTLKKEIAKDAKTVISTRIENIEVNEHNHIILHTTYSHHKTFELGNVIGKINANRPITIAYFEGSNKVIDFSQ